tara:strand:+ start:647 stop:1105 length:459 start_codon:yes stop_codon:yes gene_type:complete
MKTGWDPLETDTTIVELEKKVASIMTVLLKKAIETGCKYAKFAGRDNLSGTDMIYALQYEAHEFMDRPELEEETKDEYLDIEEAMSSDSDPECNSEGDSEGDPEEFSRADSTMNDFCYKMNHYNDTWDSWNPEDPLKLLLKKAVDCAKYNIL